MPIVQRPFDEGRPAPVVSRTKERIVAPPRSAVPVPGEGRAFGRGFVAGLRREPAGCFLILFSGVGVALFALGLAGTVGPYRASLRESGDPRFFLAAMGFGTVFFLVPLRMLQVVLTGGVNEARQERAHGPADRPWEWDYPWRPAGMRPDYTSDGGGTVLGRVAFLAFIALFNVALGSPSWLLKGIVLVLDLLGLLVLYDSFVKALQWARFREPSVAWGTFPAFLGGPLAATVRFPRRLRPTGAAKATLRCVRDEWRQRETAEGEVERQLEPQALYTEARELPLPPGAPLASLDVAFDVPDDLAGTDLQEPEATYWQLLVQVPVAGPDLETVFLAPVYRR